MAVAAAVWIGLRQRSVPLSLFLDLETWWQDLALGIAGGLVLMGFWEVARRALPIARDLERQLEELLAGIEPQEAVGLAVLSGFAEELFFRGAVLGAFSSGGWLWSSALFAVLHGGPGRNLRFWSLFAFAAGLLFAGLAVWRGNLLAPITAHTLINAVNLRRLAQQGGGGGSSDDDEAATGGDDGGE